MKISPIENPNKPLTIKAQTIMPSALQHKKEEQVEEVEKQITKSAVEPSDVSIEPPKSVSNGTPAADPNETDPRFIAISKKEKEILRGKRELDELRKNLESKYKPYEEYEAIKNDKLKLLSKLGISYDDHTNLVLGQENMTPDKIAEMKAMEIVEREMKTFRAQQQEESKKNQQIAYDNAIKQIEFDVKNLVLNRVDDFPIVKEMESFDTVRELIEETHRETGTVIPIEQAIKEVEAELEKEALKLMKIDKIRRIMLKELEQPKTEETPQNTQKTQTLTHKGTTSINTQPKEESYEQKKARLIQKYASA